MRIQVSFMDVVRAILVGVAEIQRRGAFEKKKAIS